VAEVRDADSTDDGVQVQRLRLALDAEVSRKAEGLPEVQAHHMGRKETQMMAACTNCGQVKRVEGHHDDYAFPNVVRMLCRSCHKKWHAQLVAANRDLIEWATIKVQRDTKRLIEAAKVHPRETIDDVLSRLLAKKK